jgi:hypothetical protein
MNIDEILPKYLTKDNNKNLHLLILFILMFLIFIIAIKFNLN